MVFCAVKYAQKIYLTSDNPRNEDPKIIMQEILSGIPHNKLSRVTLEVNRALAIQKAIAQLKEDEVLLVLGKGDETYQIIGDRTLHFDDSEEIKKALKAK